VEEGSIVVVPIKPEGKGFGDFATQLVTTVVPIIVATIISRQL